jgi:uncharacterized protein YciI
MLFVLIGHDGPNGAALRHTARPAHLENLKPLVDRGQMIIGGPFTDGSGSLMIVDFASEAEAIAFAHSDPYVTQGVFDRVEIKPFRKVVP